MIDSSTAADREQEESSAIGRRKDFYLRVLKLQWLARHRFTGKSLLLKRSHSILRCSFEFDNIQLQVKLSPTEFSNTRWVRNTANNAFIVLVLSMFCEVVANVRKWRIKSCFVPLRFEDEAGSGICLKQNVFQPQFLLLYFWAKYLWSCPGEIEAKGESLNSTCFSCLVFLSESRARLCRIDSPTVKS